MSPLVLCHNDLHRGTLFNANVQVCVCACVHTCVRVACRSMWAFLATRIYFMSVQIGYDWLTWSNVVSRI